MAFQTDVQATRSALQSVDTTLSEDITATQDYIPVASVTNFSTSVVAEIESTNEVVSFTDLSENQITASENLGSAIYGLLSSATVTDAQATSPAGTNTAWQLDIATANNSGIAVDTRSKGFGVGDVVTASVFVKSVSGANQDVRLLLSDGTGSNLTAHTATSEWQRISITRTFAGTGTANGLQLRNAAAGGTKSIYAWGFQIEKLGSPSTYLPTAGSALFGLTNVTRGVNGTTAQAASSGDSIQQLPYALSSVDMPIRLKGVSISSDGTGAGRLTLCDNNGDTLCDIDIPDGKIYTLFLPEEGIIFPNGVFVSNTINVTGYTVFTSKYSGPNLT